MLRHVSRDQLVLCLVTSHSTPVHWRLYYGSAGDSPSEAGVFSASHQGRIDLGARAFLHCVTITPGTQLPFDTPIGYDIGIETDATISWLADTAPTVCYGTKERPRFVLKSRVDQVLHGSCRKPHHDGDDGLLCADSILAEASAKGAEYQPAMLLCTGDQVYTDDVAGPYLSAIVQVARMLGLYTESLPSSTTIDSDSLLKDPSYYKRSSLLPSKKAAPGLQSILFKGARKPIFTSINAENHLLTLGEVVAQYLLAWSPVLWDVVDIDTPPSSLTDEQRALYIEQTEKIHRYRSSLPEVRRVLANLPTYMIFDDHDITDDWNLSRAWEDSAYKQPMARRVIGNALIGYFLFQGWGNAPHRFEPSLIDSVRELFANADTDLHDDLIGRFLKFEGWSYTIDTSPRVVVLDTRTQRWHSDQISSWPSGLMDWESLGAAQQQLLGQPSVILVSPAPIFGVKLIEVVQRLATWLGQSQTVDAENWMAHSGSAHAILNIFRHRRTPHHFVILSGDVHYAYASDILLRHVPDSPRIWQITSSGIGNSFPPKLLRIFDRLNRWLFASRSPLNWLTRRRRMRIRMRRPSNYSGRYRHQRLVNGCGIGRVVFDAEGRPVSIEHLLSSGETVEFKQGYESDWVH